ncbi:MAG: DUF5691 domain-containing protein [Chloroflexota bacterium]
MSLLPSLAITALLGTETESAVLPAVPHPLDAALARVGDTDDREAALLNLASVAGLAELAGYVPAVAASPAPAAQPETLPIIPEAAASLLRRILAGEFEDVLPEFLQRTAQKHMRLPAEALPAILNLGKYDLRPVVQQVIGERGRWLAAQNPAWAYALQRDPREAWEDGDRLERVAALEALRGEDPAHARALAESTWSQESGDDRAAFLTAFAIGLAMADEPFLEACLDDRRKGVRTAAQALLVRLPQSRLVQRTLTRLNRFVRLKSRLLGGDSFEISLPETLDADARRDGVFDDAGDMVQYRRMGEKASWLAAMLSLVTPALLSRQWGKSPEKILAAALASEWNKPLIVGLCAATQFSQDAAWAEALVALWLKQETCRTLLGRESLWALVALLPGRVLEVLLATNLQPRTTDPTDGVSLLALLGGYRRPWTDKMARLIVQNARRLATGRGRGYEFSHAFPSFALWISPSLAGEFSRGWPDQPGGGWQGRLDEFLALLDFRRQLHEAFDR